MENKNIKYLLALAVLAIWGMLGYRIYQKMKPSNDFYIPPAQEVFVADTEKDSFKLLVNYRDPFLGTKLRIPNESGSAAPAAPSQQQQVSTVIPRQVNANQNKPFPQVIYKGLIDLRTGRKVALVTAKGKTFNWAWGETFEQMTLVKIYEDSIRIKFGDTEKLILKGQ